MLKIYNTNITQNKRTVLQVGLSDVTTGPCERRSDGEDAVEDEVF